jgi:hypothetical protein
MLGTDCISVNSDRVLDTQSGERVSIAKVLHGPTVLNLGYSNSSPGVHRKFKIGTQNKKKRIQNKHLGVIYELGVCKGVQL